MFEIVLMADHSVLLAADFLCSWYCTVKFLISVLMTVAISFFPRKPLGWYVSLKSNQTDTWTENLENLTLGRTACLQERKYVTNRPFARPGHMIQNHTCWWASCAVGLSKQRQVQVDWHELHCLGSPTTQTCSPACMILYYVTGCCKGPIIHIGSAKLSLYVRTGIVLMNQFFDQGKFFVIATAYPLLVVKGLRAC